MNWLGKFSIPMVYSLSYCMATWLFLCLSSPEFVSSLWQSVAVFCCCIWCRQFCYPFHGNNSDSCICLFQHIIRQCTYSWSLSDIYHVFLTITLIIFSTSLWIIYHGAHSIILACVSILLMMMAWTESFSNNFYGVDFRFLECKIKTKVAHQFS